MPVPPHKPVLFLTFANDRDDRVRYLRNLPKETRRLREALRIAERDGLCETEIRTNATVDEILNAFLDPDYGRRTVIFH